MPKKHLDVTGMSIGKEVKLEMLIWKTAGIDV